MLSPVCRAFVDALGSPVCVLDAAGNAVHVSPAACDTLGLGPAEALGLRFDQLAMRLDLGDVPADVTSWPPRTVASAGVPGGLGRESRVEVALLRVDDGETTWGIVVMGDAEATEAQRRLQESERRFRALFNAARDAVFLHDLSGRFLEVNDAMCSRLGYNRQELLEMSLADIVAPQYAGLISERIGDLVARGQALFESAHTARDGAVIPVELSCRAIQHGGQPLILSIVRDISERKRNEDLLRSRDFLQVLVDNLPVAVFVKSVANGRYSLWNRAAQELSGLSAAEVVGRSDSDLMEPQQVEAVSGLECRVLGDGPAETAEGPAAAIPGRATGLQTVRVPLQAEDGTPSAVVGIATDVSEARAAEEALKASNEVLRNVLAGLDEAVLVIDPTDGSICECNLTAGRLLGYDADELRTMTVWDLHVASSEEDWAELEAAFRGQSAGRLVRQCHMRRPDGRAFPAEHSVSAIPSDGGEPRRVICVIRDFSHRQKAEGADRLAAVGQLAAGIAHEFNNILAGMLMRAERASMTGSVQEYERLADLVIRGSDRGALITQRLATFAGPGEMANEPLVVGEVLDSAFAAVEHQLGPGAVRVIRRYAGLPATVRGDADRLQLAFTNIITNARHAMPDGGEITAEVRMLTDPHAGEQVLVRISDTGSGIAPDDLPRVFEPFFTTKGLLGGSEVPGMGLGLGIAHGICQAHGGHIDLESRPGFGTTVEIVLPLAEDELADGLSGDLGSVGGLANRAPRMPGPRGPRVLLADDEPEIVQLIAECLEPLNCSVVSARSGTEAVEALQALEFDLVITDMLMPGGGGRAVLAQVAKLPQSPPVLVITGRADQAHEVSPSDCDRACLVKPFSLSDVLQTVERLLGRGQSVPG